MNHILLNFGSIEMQLFMKSCDLNMYLFGSRLPYKHPSCHVYSVIDPKHMLGVKSNRQF